MSDYPDKRKSVEVSKEETETIRWLFLKTLFPMTLIIVVSCIVLFFGLQFLIKDVSFSNYGITPGATLHHASRFISSYIFIAVTNVILMLGLSVLVMYLVLHDIVMPVIRITRELRNTAASGEPPKLTVRSSDRLLVPLVEVINELIEKKK
jgi:flagellar biosynthesis protein FlhB